MRAIVVFALAFAVASPAMAGPANSTIGGKQLEEEMVHSAGAGYPSIMYEWWNKGPGSLDWALQGDLAYGDWPTSFNDPRFTKIGLGIGGILRWHLATKERPKVTNDVAIVAKPGILIGSTRFDRFMFGIRLEPGAAVSIDVHKRVSVVTGGYIPFVYYIFKDVSNSGAVPFLARLGVEIDAGDRVSPWFYFDLGPAVQFSQGGSTSAAFAWRIAVGTTFWNVLGGKPASSTSDVSMETTEIETE